MGSLENIIKGKNKTKQQQPETPTVQFLLWLFYNQESTSHFGSQRRVVHNSFILIFSGRDPGGYMHQQKLLSIRVNLPLHRSAGHMLIAY